MQTLVGRSNNKEYIYFENDPSRNSTEQRPTLDGQSCEVVVVACDIFQTKMHAVRLRL